MENEVQESVQFSKSSEQENTQQTTQTMQNFDEDLLVTLRVDPNYPEPVLHQVLRIAVYDEFHAYETYKKIIEKFGPVEPFGNIMQAEIRHYEALIPLLQKYSVPIPVNDWEEKIEIPNSILEASEIGVVAEIDNIKMYDNLISYVKGYPDIVDVLYKLQAASYNNHLPAFRQSVAKHSQQNIQNIDINSIYQNYSAHETIPSKEDIKVKMDEFNQMATKLASGQLSQEDLLKFLGNTNLSFIGGALVGAVGGMVVSQMSKEGDQQEEF